jgi:hypothetical protein
MKALLFTRTTLVWAVLVAATVFSFEVGVGAGAWLNGIAILIVAFAKVRLVAQDFMEVRHAPKGLQIAADLWIGGVCTLLVGLYVLGGSASP